MMESVKVELECSMCGNFKTEHFLDTNEHGYFAFPDAYCPKCYALLTVKINWGKNEDAN